MRTMRLLEAFSDINDRYIREAWFFRKKRAWRRILPAVACLIVVGLIFFILPRPSQKPSPSADLLMLQLDFAAGGMGFEGYMAYHIDELVSENPWREDMALSTLPVYQNPGQPTDTDMEAMQAWALEIADRLGFSETDLTITDNRLSEEERAALIEKYAAVGEKFPEEFFEPSQVIVTAKGIKITVDARLEATIEFDPAISLPQEYNFTHHASYEDTLAVAGYLLEHYRGLLGMEQPVINVFGGDYNIYDKQSYHIGFYEGAGDIVEQIVNYNLCMANFACNDDGELFLVRIRAGAPALKLGDYPIITADEAWELLEQGHFLTTVPAELPGMDYVRRVELIYRQSWEATRIPYYRFYVELPDMVAGKRKTFGAYYVPAVDRKYIENMPLWDGSFN